jgi:DNA-binding transcriptional MerR regulator
MRNHRLSRDELNPASVARRTGLSVKTLRYYERRGLLKPKRNRRGWRIYDAAQLERLEHIRAYKAMGLGLSQIATLLDAGPDIVAEVLATQEQALQKRIDDLRDALDHVRSARSRLCRRGEAWQRTIHERPVVIAGARLSCRGGDLPPHRPQRLQAVASSRKAA